MDSLLATYASSDDEEEERHNSAPPPPPSSSIATKSSSLFLSLPKPKLPQHPPNPSSIQHDDDEEEEDPNPKPKNSRVGRSFLSLPQPKSQKPPSTPSNPKRVVQFKPPIPSFPSSIKSTDLDDEDDDDDRDNKDRERKSQSLAQSVSVTSFLSSIPAPKNSSATLGAMPSSGSGRRSIVEADVPASSRENSAGADKDSGTHPISGNYVDQNPGNHVDYGNYELGYDQNAGNYEVVQNSGSYVNYDAYGNYQSEPATTGNYYGGSNESYENNWSDGLMQNTVPEIAGKKKRGRNEVPTEIVEVKQDELMKNRPREDQTKATGIAFGPSYQPVSTKGKPTKLHKRKHQIGSLFYDMKQKEMELAERRSRGFLTKAETQAKYGW